MNPAMLKIQCHKVHYISGWNNVSLIVKKHFFCLFFLLHNDEGSKNS